MNSTCVEITPSGKSNVWVACPYYNLPQIVLEVIDDVASGRLAEPQDLDAVIGEFSQRLSAQIAAGVAQYNALRHACEAHRNFPLASCFVQDCLERARILTRVGRGTTGSSAASLASRLLPTASRPSTSSCWRGMT